MPLLAASDWRQPIQWQVVEFGDMTDAQPAVAIILLRLEQPYGSTLMKLDALRRKLAEVGLTAEEWNIFVSCLCMEGFIVRKHTANATNSTHAGRLLVRGCCTVHDSDETAANCGLFYPPDKQYDGRHEFDMGKYRPRPCEDSEESHVVGQQAQLALIIA